MEAPHGSHGGLMSEHCRSCGAAVIWAHTERGKRMPIDAEPVGHVGGGNIQLMHREGLPPLAVYLGQDTIAHLEGFQMERLHTSHFATCPHAKKWRRP
jgi:hypothetical protein